MLPVLASPLTGSFPRALFALAVTTFVGVGVFWCVFVFLWAPSSSSALVTDMKTISNQIASVFSRRTPLQIAEVIVGFVVIKMSDMRSRRSSRTRRAWSHPSNSDKIMDRIVLVAQLDLKIGTFVSFVPHTNGEIAVLRPSPTTRTDHSGAIFVDEITARKSRDFSDSYQVRHGSNHTISEVAW